MLASKCRDRAEEKLPKTQEFRYQPWPEDEGAIVEFRLIYRGPLPAQGSGTGGSRLDAKHAIRKQFHKQLRELWVQHSVLKSYMQENIDQGTGKRVSYAIVTAAQYTIGAYHFLPLISRERGIGCSLDILFLRRDNPGNLIESGGDLDNRMKVLFDGLRVPKYLAELADTEPDGSEDPFCVLLEDDTLITDVRITTDRLLTPQVDEEHIHDVHLVIHVKSKVVDDRLAFNMWR
jgi:hypothetical protein